MQVNCPSCQTTLRLTSAPPAGALITCPKCGTKFRLGGSAAPVAAGSDTGPADEPGESAPQVRKKKKKSGTGKRQDSFAGFAVKAGVAIVGLAVLIVLGYIGIHWMSNSAAAAGEFSKKMSGWEENLKVAASQYMTEWQQDPDKGKVMERTLARVGFVRDQMRKVDPPSDGKAWYDALDRVAQGLEKFFRDLDQLRSMPQDEALQAGRSLGAKWQEQITRLQAEIDAAKKAFNEKHGLK